MRGHRRWLLLWVLPALTLLGSCDSEPTRPAAEDTRREAPAFPMGPHGAQKYWLEGSLVNIEVQMEGGTPSQSVLNEISAAADEWNTYVLDLQGYYSSLPHLNESVDTSITSEPKILIEYFEQGNWGWCGEYIGEKEGTDSTRILRIWKKNESDTCGGRIVQDLEGVAVHEMGHALGFLDFNTEATRWCVVNFPDTGDPNHHPCSFEQQAIYATYGLRSPDPSAELPLVKTLEVSPPRDTLFIGDTTRYEVIAIVGPEPSDPQQTEDTVSALVSWIPSDTQIISKVDESESWVDVVGVGLGAAELTVQADPDEATVWPWPGDAADVTVVRESGLVTRFTEESTDTWRYTDQFLSAGRSSTGPDIVYRWRFKATGPWTAYSSDTLFEYSGHATAGAKSVTLEVKSTATGDTALVDKDFSVGSGIVSLAGPTWITQKALYTYTSNQTGDWYERRDPDTNLEWLIGLYNSDTYNRIWAMGDYTIAVRSHKLAGGYLRRRRLDVEVCWERLPQCEVTAESIAGAGAGHRTSMQATAGPDYIFGAGPWISAGSEASPEMARFYDLTGLHEPNSAFANADWLNGGRGVTTDAAGRWTLEWHNLDVADPNITGFEFTVSPLTGGSYVFGMAADPDLSGTPGDDESGYDPERGMVYVLDSSMAVGFLLRDGRADALVKARQFGARVQAPRAKPAAWRAHRASGIEVSPGSDDVQLILSTDETSGSRSWTLWIVRGDSLKEIRKLADEVLSEWVE